MKYAISIILILSMSLVSFAEENTEPQERPKIPLPESVVENPTPIILPATQTPVEPVALILPSVGDAEQKDLAHAAEILKAIVTSRNTATSSGVMVENLGEGTQSNQMAASMMNTVAVSEQNVPTVAELVQSLATTDKGYELAASLITEIAVHDMDIALKIIEEVKVEIAKTENTVKDVKIKRAQHGALAMMYASIGAQDELDQQLESAGLTLVERTPQNLPSFFTSLGAVNWSHLTGGEEWNALSDLPLPNVMIRLVGGDYDGALESVNALPEGTRVVLVCSDQALEGDTIQILKSILAKHELICIIVGHFGATDINLDTVQQRADKVMSLTSIIKRVSHAPVLLSHSMIMEARGHESQPPLIWTEAFGENISEFDGFAIYNITTFLAIEFWDTQSVRERLQLPNKPMVILDFVGSGFGRKELNDKQQQRLVIQWQNKTIPMLNRIQAKGWQGISYITIAGKDESWKYDIFRTLPNDLIYRQ